MRACDRSIPVVVTSPNEMSSNSFRLASQRYFDQL